MSQLLLTLEAFIRFRVVIIVLLLRFPGKSDQKLTISLKNCDTFAISFLFISKKHLHSRNAKEYKGVFRSIQAVADIGFDVRFALSV